MFTKSRIKSITPIGKRLVCDITVQDDHSYIGNGFVNHNSSRNPNGQNIPKVTVNPDVKKQFITPPGELFFAYDYSQAELRILAHLANETTMLEWFRTGKDIHLASACKKYNEDYEEILKIYHNELHPRYTEWEIKRKQAKCYSGDTEILTEVGWQRLDSYDNISMVAQYNFDSEEISFTKPEAYGKVISEVNYTYSDRNISIDVTEEHKTLFITRAGVKMKEDFRDLVGKSGYMPCAGSMPIKGESESFVRFLSMFTADGNYNGSGKIRFGFTKSRKIDRCIEILNSLGVTYTNPKPSKFYIPKKENLWLYEKLSKYVSREKVLSWDCLRGIHGGIFLEEASYWDSHVNRFKMVSFSTIVKQTAEVMQALGTISDRRVILRERLSKRGRMVYHLSYSLEHKKYSRVNLGNANRYVVPGGRDMWSVTVPDRNLITRKDGKVVLSGNTINFGIVYEQSAAKLAESLSTPANKLEKSDGQKFLDDYFETFPKIKKFMDRQHKFMEDNGFCVSLFGRKRRCPNVYSEKYGEYLEALRQSTNMPCQSAASDMALFASILVWEQVRLGKLPPMKECTTVHDSVYQFIKPKFITPDLVYKVWDICRNPSTKEYFGFSIDDVDMSMDFSIGRTMAEVLPYIPGYDYNRLISAPSPEDKEAYQLFKNEYFGEHAKTRDISIKDYPVKYKSYFKEERVVWKNQ